MSDPDVLYLPQLAARLGMTVDAARKSIQRNNGATPPVFRLGRKIACRPETLERWLAKKDSAGGKV
jgi:hypothetical protein